MTMSVIVQSSCLVVGSSCTTPKQWTMADLNTFCEWIGYSLIDCCSSSASLISEMFIFADMWFAIYPPYHIALVCKYRYASVILILKKNATCPV